MSENFDHIGEALAAAGVVGWRYVHDVRKPGEKEGEFVTKGPADLDDAYANHVQWIDEKGEWGGAPKKTKAELAAILAAYVAPGRRVAKLLIVERLKAAGLLVAANAALNNVETPDAIELAERWYRAPDTVAVNDPRVLAFLAAIGASAGEILAP